MDIQNIKKVFFVGIGGVGISAIARMFLAQGKEVYGSDMQENGVVQELRTAGAHITIGQNFDLIPSDCDLIVYTIAINHYDEALYTKITTGNVVAKSYPEMLAIVTKGKRTIGVSGTHGKTTTTAMIATGLMHTDRDPSVIVGSILSEYHSNLIVGESEYFVVEACEYERSFLNIHPSVAVITNIEADHLDYYKDIEDIKNAFSQFIAQTTEAIVCDLGDENIRSVVADTKLKVIDSRQYMDKLPELAVPGEHNRKDAALALGVLDYLGVPIDEAGKAVANFRGTARRLEKRGVLASGALIYDDYAHHPTEVRASLQAIREAYPDKKITVLFQPHLYSRTKALFDDFVQSFSGADMVYFLPIYFAREAQDSSISSELLAEKISGAKVFAGLAEAEKHFKNNPFGIDDVLVTMGAGEAYKVGDALLK